ncbi:MAG: hypothetical protein WA817_23820 [Candidatus Acidiferrum sp.]
MGYVDDNGEYHYQPGFGAGLEGSRYVSESPQGQFGPANTPQATRLRGALPYWTKDADRRAHVLLVFFERRANKSLKVPPGDLRTRLETVTAKLEAARQEEVRLIRERLDFGDNWRDKIRLKFLEKTGEFTAWTRSVLKDYFFDAADCPDGVTQSWDAGQCAFRHGDVGKIFVKQLIRKVDAIGNELYPEPH